MGQFLECGISPVEKKGAEKETRNIEPPAQLGKFSYLDPAERIGEVQEEHHGRARTGGGVSKALVAFASTHSIA